jgi:CSLREA domain-containing protein
MRRLWFSTLIVAGGALLASCHGGPHSFTVTTTTDGSDADPGDGVCEMTAGVGDCSLRAAIDEANTTPDQVDVLIPEGSYQLTVAGSDDTNAVGDLDVVVTGKLNLIGQGAGVEIDAGGLDGAVQLHTGSLELQRVAVTGAAGPGLAVDAPGVASVVLGSLHGNAGPGLAIESGAQASLLHSTVSGNGSAGGGGIAAAGNLVADFVTITGNTGGGITGTASPTLGQSVVANQASGPGCATPATSTGWNLSSDATCTWNGPGDMGGETVSLQPLSSDLVPFHELGAGSKAMDSIPVDSGACGTGFDTVDQRLAPRPTGGACDRGATEAPSDLALIVDNPFDVVDAAPGDGVCDVGDGTCTLRAAVTETNASAGPDVVTLAVSPTLARPGVAEDGNATGDLDVRDSLTITGAGHIIDGGDLDRVIDHRRGRLELDDLTVTDGSIMSAPGSTSGGGVLSSDGTLALTNVDISSNNATHGGGIDVSGRLEVEQSSIRDNSADTNGGGLLVRSELTQLAPGAWLVPASEARIVATQISGNRAANGSAGGLGGSGDIELLRSTVSGNRAKTTGGGVGSGFCASFGVACATDLRIISSTISGNTAQEGGGIHTTFEEWDSATVLASTIFQNTATGNPSNGKAGGGVAGSGPFSIGASIVGENVGDDCAVTLSTLGGNLDSDGTCGFGAGDLPSTDPLLGALADNGGPTPTHLPYGISPVIDAIAPGTAGLCDGALPIDQRGETRPAGGGCDVGAVEGNDPGAVPFVAVVDTALDAPDAAPGDAVCAAVGGGCTLRAAVDEANASPHPLNRITIADGIEPVLSIAGVSEDANATGDLDLTAPVTLSGAGATVDGGQIDRVLDVASTGVVVEDVTIRNGRLTDLVGRGAGIQVRTGALLLRRSTVTANRLTGTSGRGGGIAALPSTTLVVERSTINANVVGGFSGRGGGVHAEGATVTVAVSTLSGNQAFAGAALSAQGGNVALLGSTLTASLGHSTLGGGTAVYARATIIGPGTVVGCSSAIAGGGTNTSFDATCGFPPERSNLDPMLGPLAANGGPTLTHLLPVASPLRDIVPLGVECEDVSEVDQRGAPRPQGTACDVGAVEGS